MGLFLKAISVFLELKTFLKNDHKTEALTGKIILVYVHFTNEIGWFCKLCSVCVCVCERDLQLNIRK